MTITYPDALAACVARWGEPSREYTTALGLRVALWTSPDHGTERGLYGSGGAVWLECAHADVLRATVWHLAREGDVTPIPAALDAADAWRRRA